MLLLDWRGMRNATISEELTHRTPGGNELRAQVVYDANGPQVAELKVIDPHTGIIKSLGEKAALDLRDALYATQMKERAQVDVVQLENTFGRLAEKLGRDNPNIAPQLHELDRMREFVEVAQNRAELLTQRVDREADKMLSSLGGNEALPNLRNGGLRQV